MQAMTASNEITQGAGVADLYQQASEPQPRTDATPPAEVFKAVLKHRVGRDFLRLALVREFTICGSNEPAAMARTIEHNQFAYMLLEEFATHCPDLYLLYVKESLELRQQADQ